MYKTRQTKRIMQKSGLLAAVIILVFTLNSFSQEKSVKTSQKSTVVKTSKKDVKEGTKATKSEPTVEVKALDDKAVQTDKIISGQKGPDGQMVFEGPKGGQYYFNKNGNKTYLKPDDNIVPGKKGPDGQSVYLGPKGGQYYINKNGNKTFITPDKK
jgi:colicin import membrane protein